MPDPVQAPCHPLTEHIQDWKTQEGSVDSENCIVKNVALTGQESSNGYRYSEHALKEGLPLYENKPVFLDHAASRQQPHHRSTRDLVGSIINVRYDGGRIRGDIRVIDTEAGRIFLALAESNAPAVGMSHVVLAEKNAEGTTVEKIHDVVSVDAVVFPATTKSFQEQLDAIGCEQVGNDLANLTSQRDSLEKEIALLEGKLDRLQLQREVDQLLDQAGLPLKAISEVFRNQLLQAPSIEARRILIQERRALLDSLAFPSRAPLSQERLQDERTANPTLTDEQFLSAIRR